MVHQPSEQLHGHVLERQRRPVEELEHEQVVVELDQGADGRVPEGRVGRVDHAPKAGSGMSPSISGPSTVLATSA